MFHLHPSSRRKRKQRLSFIDLICLLFSPFIALWLRDPSLLDPSGFPHTIPLPYQYAFITILSTCPFFMLFPLSDGINHHFSSYDAIVVIEVTLFSVVTSVFTVFSISRLDGIPRTVPINFGLILMSGLLIYRLLKSSFYEKHNKQLTFLTNLKDRQLSRRVIIVGLDAFAISVFRLVNSQRPRTIEVIAFISFLNKNVGRSILGVKVLGTIKEIPAIINEYKIHGISTDEVWISDSSKYFDISAFLSCKHDYEKLGISFKTISDALSLTPNIYLAENNNTHYEIRLSSYFLLKRCMDIFCALLILLFLSPLMIGVCMLTLIFLGKPVIFWQERVGRYGANFFLYKIRTLMNPYNISGEFIHEKDRNTRFGSLIRRFRIDEFPQLFNIIAGEMSCIGPRPLLPIDQPKNNSIRLLVRPGITGWAQVNGGELLTAEEKNALDIWYICNSSFVLDIHIVFKTIQVLIYGIKRNEQTINEMRAWIENKFDKNDI